MLVVVDVVYYEDEYFVYSVVGFVYFEWEIEVFFMVVSGYLGFGWFGGDIDIDELCWVFGFDNMYEVL